jgi:hypothetical protein
MEMTKYYLVLKEQWKGQNATLSRKSNGNDKILPGLARAMARIKYYLVSSKSNGKDKIR